MLQPPYKLHVLAPPQLSMAGSCSATDLMTMPLSMEKLSVGSPAMVQARILTGSPSVELRESSSEQGMLRLVHMVRHSSICSWCSHGGEEEEEEKMYLNAGEEK